MSSAKTSAHRHQRARHGTQRPKPAVKPMSDRAVYVGIIIVGLFVVMIGWLFTDGVYWRQTLLGYTLLMILSINFAGWDVCRGRRLPDWKHSLAKIPLRFAGFGTAAGKPLDAAHHQPAAKAAMFRFGIISIVLSAALTVLLLWPW